MLTPKGIAEKAAITKRFFAQKMEEYASLRAEVDTLRNELAEETRTIGNK